MQLVDKGLIIYKDTKLTLVPYGFLWEISIIFINLCLHRHVLNQFD